jgi:hypothetical protein
MSDFGDISFMLNDGIGYQIQTQRNLTVENSGGFLGDYSNWQVRS